MAVQILDRTAAMNAAVEKIRKKCIKKSCCWNLALTFTSKKLCKLKVKIYGKAVDKFTIEQDFINNITDKIMVDLTLDRDQYITLYYGRKDLECQVEFCHVDPTLGQADAAKRNKEQGEDFDLKFKAVVTQYDDIFKKITVDRQWPMYWDGKCSPCRASGDRDESDRDRATYKMKVELISTDIFLARKKMLNIIAKEVVMPEMMEAAATFFGIKCQQFAKPDNKFKYTNFIVPSKGIEEIMAYYQNAPGLGIYNNGLVSYVTRYWKKIKKNCWYVYPRYGELRKDNPIHIYSVGSNIEYGALQWHYKCPSAGVNILINNEVDMKNWSDVGTENEYTGYDVQISEKLLDGMRTLVHDGKFVIRKETSQFGDLSTDAIDTKNTVRIKRVQSQANFFKLKSELRAPQGTSITFKWDFCEPWIFTPCTKVFFYYDHALQMKKITASCEKVVYTFRQYKEKPVHPVFVCQAEVTLNSDNVQPAGKSHV